MSRNGLIGVGGWLTVLVVTLGLYATWNILVGYGVAQVAAREPTQALQSFALVIAACLALSAAGHALLIWLLVARQRAGTVRLAIATLWTLALLMPLSTLAGRAAFMGSAYHAVFGADVLYPFAYAAIWTAYLLRSERVANTYAPPGGDLAAVFD